MKTRLSENDFMAMNVACQIFFGRSYAEFIDTLIQVGVILSDFIEQQKEAEKVEQQPNFQSMPEIAQAPIGFRTA